MPDFVLVAIVHELAEDGSGEDRLMSRECHVRFLAEVAPLMTNASLVFSEGFYHPKLLGSEHPLYERIQKSLLDLPDGLRPTLGGVDFRQRHIKSNEDYYRLGERQDQWESVAKSILRFDHRGIPTSLENMIASLQTYTPCVFSLRTPTSDERNLAREISAQSRKFNRVYLDAMRAHGRRFDRCFFVGGATHVVAMALKTTYRVVSLVPDSEIRHIFDAYLAEYQGTRHMIGEKPER